MRAVIKLFFLQGKTPKEIYATLTETLVCLLPSRAKDLSAEYPRRLSSLYIYTHIYIYIYTHAYILTHKHTHTHIHIYIHTHTHTQNLCCVAYIYLRNWEHISEIVPNSREEGRYKNSPTVRSFMRNLLVELRSSFLLWALHSENVEANKDNGYRIPTGSRYLWTN